MQTVRQMLELASRRGFDGRAEIPARDPHLNPPPFRGRKHIRLALIVRKMPEVQPTLTLPLQGGG